MMVLRSGPRILERWTWPGKILLSFGIPNAVRIIASYSARVKG
jgi:hypothetical protein